MLGVFWLVFRSWHYLAVFVLTLILDLSFLSKHSCVISITVYAKGI